MSFLVLCSMNVVSIILVLTYVVSVPVFCDFLCFPSVYVAVVDFVDGFALR